MMRLGVLVRRVGTLATMEKARRHLVVEAAFALLRARLLLLMVPFRRVSANWGVLVSAGDRQAQPSDAYAAPPAEQGRTAKSIGWAVRTSASAVPFDAMCLQQAVAARGMLARRGIVALIHYGAGRDSAGRLVAHAWVDAAGVQVTGYPVAPHIAEIGIFVPQR